MDAPAAQSAPLLPVPPAPEAVPTASSPADGQSPYAVTAYGPPAYGTPTYGAPYGTSASWAPAPAPQNVLAWVSFGLAFAGLMLGPLSSIAAIVCGHIARRQIRERGDQGSGAALTGVIAGYAITALWVVGIALYVLFIVAMIAFSATAGGAYSTP